MAGQEARPASDLESREDVLTQILASIDRYHGIPKDGLVPEQHASAVVSLARARDLLSLEIAEHSIAIEKSGAWEDWGSVSSHTWLRHEGKMTSTAAADCLHVGEQLANLPRTLEAVRDGKIGFAHAAIIARHAQAITHSDSSDPFDEAPFLKAAQHSSVGRLWYHALHNWHRNDPEGVAQEQRRLAEERYLSLTDHEDGTVHLKGTLDSSSGATLRTALEPLAQPHGDKDERGRERRQADALIEMASHALDTGTVPQHGSVRPHVQVTTTLETLQGLIGAPAGEMAPSLPISYKTVQRLACDSSITRVLLGSDSAIIDAGRSKRVVSYGARRLLDGRDKRCRWPGCDRTSTWTVAHHIRHWAQGGKTDLSNLILLCQHHHWMVHEGGWRLSLSADGRVLAIPPETDFYLSPYVAAEFDAAARGPDEYDAA